jgi:CPA2 family monovalent cation:H+ antiporter-2
VIIEKAEPSWLSRSLELYHKWLAQLGTLQSGQLWWQLSKKNLLQIVLEALFITGLLAFSKRLLVAFQNSSISEILTPATLTIIFWLVIGLLVLAPLIAIWLHLDALAMIFAEASASRSRLPASIILNCFKIFSALGIAYWIYQIIPTESLPWWAWLAIAAGLGGFLATFSSRLIFWHSQWQSSLQETLSDNPFPERLLQRQWLERSGDWGINVQEFTIPEHAACAGRSIAELGVRSRYGCSIVEIDRQGHTIITPKPSQALYSGDRLLLLGTLEQITAVRTGLSSIDAGKDVTAFDQAHLDPVIVPVGPHSGRTLGELQIARKLGVLVTAINRSGAMIVNPEGSECLGVGDELLVLGAPEQIRVFRKWLESGLT